MSDQFTIILDVDLSRPKTRAVTVSGARAGRLPIIQSGAFSERHQLADAIYAALIKQKPVATAKAKSAKRKSKTAAPAAIIEPAPADENDGGGEVESIETAGEQS